MSDESTNPHKDGEILGPSSGNDGEVGDNYIALISQYTERPDLLIEVLEKNDPGFVKRMNEQSEESSGKMSEARFRFGGIQAYTGLAISAIAAVGILGILGFAVISGKAGFWMIIALAIFYAVTQGGPSGFVEIVRGIADYFRKDKSNPNGQ